MAMRRGRDSSLGSGYSRMTSVAGSALAILFELNSSKNGVPFESRRTPYGRELTVGDSTSLMAPFGAFGSRVPMKLPACTVKKIRPSRRKAIVWGSFAFGFGILYSVTLPVFASTLPISPAAFPVYQTLPSLSTCRPCGPELGVGSGNSLNCSVAGSNRPMVLARCAVYQIDPSGATAGSCGYAGLLGVIHSSIFTSTASEIAGRAFRAATEAAASTIKANAFTRIIKCPPDEEDCNPGRPHSDRL